MRPYRLYNPNLTIGLASLSEEESHHAQNVLRCRLGDEVLLFDGVGHEGLGMISGIQRHRVLVDVREIQERPLDLAYRITIAVAIPKTHRQGILVEKCTELGGHAIWPILAERSVTQPGDAVAVKWTRRAIEAAKQCHRAHIPEIAEPQGVSDVLRRCGEFDAAVMAQEGANSMNFSQWLDSQSLGASILVMIGPEGGWARAEITEAQAGGAVICSLGPTVLRTETAAIAACAIGCGRPTSMHLGPTATKGRQHE